MSYQLLGTKTKVFCFILGTLIIFQALWIPTKYSEAADFVELPKIYIDTTFPTLPADHSIYNVKPTCASGDTNCFTSLQSAINAAVQGSEIIVAAGMNINGKITLKKKSGNGWIIIRSSELPQMPENHRVSPASAGLMPKIVSPGSGVVAISADNGAHDYWLAGIEVAKIPNQNLVTLIELGSTGITIPEDYPSNIVLDRMYIHGDTATALRRCVSMQGRFQSAINSYISECHEKGSGDSQGIAGWNGTGPFKIVNNFISAAAENVIFGGSPPAVPNTQAYDIEVRGNYMYKDPAWKISKLWSIKNIFELKAAQRVLIEGNVFENSWTDAQTGIGILFKTANHGSCDLCETKNVTFTNNIIKNVEEALTINANEKASGVVNLPQPSNHYLIKNNLFTTVSRRLFYINGGVDSASFDHNTAVGGNTILLGSDLDKQNPNFQFTNNIVKRGNYGIGTGANEGKPTLDAKFYPYTYNKNLLVNYSTSSDTNIQNRYPATTYVVNESAVGFTDAANADFALTSNSTYKNLATDGSELGANYSSLNSATANAVSGNGINSTPSPLPSPTPTSVQTPTPTPTPTPSPSSGGSPTPVPMVAEYADGSLLADAGTIYAIEYGEKRPFVSMDVFTGLGYKLSSIINTITNFITQGAGIFSANQRHVRGTVVNDHGTIYYLGSQVRYPYPSAEVFYSWGQSFDKVVPANSFDLALPIGAVVQMK